MYEIRKHKNQIRTTYMEKRKVLPLGQKEVFDRKICNTFLSLASYRYSDTILMYASLKNEINVLPIAEHALRNHRIVAFPRCNPDDCTMEYYVVTSLSQLEKGSYGILEPPTDLPLYRGEGNRRVCLVPGLVYDKSGYRLGYGKGYYDRYLPNFTGTKVGLIYDSCLVCEVPKGRYDLAVDVIVTEKAVKVTYAN